MLRVSDFESGVGISIRQAHQEKAFEAIKSYDFGNHELGVSEALKLIAALTDRLRWPNKVVIHFPNIQSQTILKNKRSQGHR